ncbi:uncharacterized protein LOC115233408 isoform X1 [Formica exsecta]|uniref:uncharacterized protein LOC115233408 isoform X1 n=1 Tax=Formica exsecta TaxID=72781 RepID=UPI00114340A1|nr:uncharacterized protein LOC115233408 isoform X1 [Formica exsecta]
MSGQSGGHRVRLAKLNEQLTCKLCGGYFIDATTIIECLHSFCRSCIVKYLENNKYCPICEVQVHKSRPLLNIRPDHTLQDIVYKLVPGCYQNEMRCRREFYAKHPEICGQTMSPEARGEPIESHIYSPDESLSLSLEYFNPHTKDLNEVNAIKDGTQKPILRRYFRCPAAVTIFHLQKLIRAKYGLGDANRVDIMYKEEQLCSSYSLMDIMYIYHWRRKVPLHLSYRIFESSLKRMKLSEDNANYKKSLKDAGIDSIELKDEKSVKREWKEVQLKISETGVMSITDISSTVHKRDGGIENLQDEKSSEQTITSIVEVNKTDSLIENCDVSNSSSVEIMQSTVAIDTQITKNPIFPNSSNAFLATSDVKIITRSTTENSSIKNCTSPSTQHNGNTAKQGNETGNRTVPPKLQQDAREVKGRNQNANVEDKPGQKTINQSVTQLAEESANIVENTDGTKKLSINNNNNSTDFKAETPKECVKNTSVEAKTGNAGSKIDALSVKLQFQPKMGQVNNTYSKKAPKEKRAILQQGTKKSDVRSSTESTKLSDTKTRTSCGNTTAKISVSCSTAISPQKSVVSAIASRNSSSATDTGSGRQETLYEKDNQNTNIDVQQALNLLEQKTANSPVQASMESVPRTSSNHVTSTVNQRLQVTSSNNNNNNTATTNENIVFTIVPNSSTSTVSQTTSSTTFPYTLHDIVINSAAVKPTFKNSSVAGSCTTLQKALGTSPVVACSTSNSQASLMPTQFNVQTPSMSIYSVSMPLKSNCGNTTQGISTVTATSTATITVTASKPTSVCSVPPCPDAIPISFMKQASMRKQEATAKGTNLNEICAKIGSIGTIGSKINDICAKIGENSKEKNRVEQARNKSDVPDLLKIGTKKSPSSSLSNSDTTIKHIPNIPNVPVYNPSSNATTMENKNAKPVSAGALAVSLAVSSTVTSLAPTSSPQMTQRMSSLKKQSQPIGYKTLRDPPKSWNPTLSKNNYVAVKNQAKEMQNQTQTTSASEGTSKQIPSKPAKIFKMRNVPRYLGNPASGVKPMYGVTNDAKEKEQSAVANTKNATLNMMKIDPKTLSPIVSTINSPIVSPPPYSPNARSYQNTPYPRDICRSTGSPISPRNSPVNMLSTNPFIPSPTPNTNPRIIFSHFPPPFPDASRFPNPLIRSPIGIPPPSAFHSSLPPSINKLYQRSASYIPQTTSSYSPVSSQPPAVQRIPPSTHSSSPKSPKASSPSSISCTSFNLGKVESQSPITSTVADNVALLLSKNVPVPIPVPSLQRELNAFNLSKTGGSLGPTSNVVVVKTSSATDTSNADTIETQTAKQNSSAVSHNSASSAEIPGNSNSPSSTGERKHCKNADPAQKTTQEMARGPKEESSKAKPTEARCSAEIVDNAMGPSPDKKEKNQAARVNGDVTTDQFASKNPKEANSDEVTTPMTETTERDCQVERSSSRERNSIPNSNAQDNNISDSSSANESKNDKSGEQIQGKKSEVQRNKAET